MPHVIVNLGLAKLKLDASWILICPLVLWGTHSIYIPLLNSSVSPLSAWGVSAAIVALILFSLIIHVLSHGVVARLFHAQAPSAIPLYLLADSAQVWPKGPGPGRDILSTLAGPASQILLAGIAYFIWNQQINDYVNLIALFLSFFNLTTAAVNLYPAFPLDGGRLVRAIVWVVFNIPAGGNRLAQRFGFGLIIGLTAWGIILAAQHARLVWGAASIAFIQAGLILISLLLGGSLEPIETNDRSKPGLSLFRGISATLLMFPMFLIVLGLLPLNYGLNAPGTTASVEPMVHLPSQYTYASKGSLILTSVIPQAPILCAEWVYAHFDKALQLVPEEEIFPPDQSVESQAAQGLQMLVSSETIAMVEGLRLAGYPATENSDGVAVISISAGSGAAEVLKTNDIINSFNGNAVYSISDLQGQLLGLPTGAIISMGITRTGQHMDVRVTAMAPSEPGGPVRIGIVAQDHITGYTLPFPVAIFPEKIIGGPSAGLMFTLAVYDLVTPGDLTGGRKVAGTGTIDLDGKVGPIGGVQQKVAAAERAGAEYFLAPVENYRDALSVAKKIKVVQVASAQEAIDFLAGLPQMVNPGK